jgi:hypothetical protein
LKCPSQAGTVEFPDPGLLTLEEIQAMVSMVASDSYLNLAITRLSWFGGRKHHFRTLSVSLQRTTQNTNSSKPLFW